MAFVLICLILGLALAIERIIYLNMATTNSAKLVEGSKRRWAKAAKKLPKKFAATPEAQWRPSSTRLGPLSGQLRRSSEGH